jgi:phospholipid/cholesterol/gamma-HCH transport system ATP-binding protein
MAHPTGSPTSVNRTNEANDAHVVIDDVTMRFGRRTVFEDRSCVFPRGKISVILGGSGSGKSTMLRLIAGLVKPVSGRVLVDGEQINRLSERRLRKVRRKLGMMFQGGALLDSLSVFDNVAFPLREHTRMGQAEIAGEVHARLESVGLTNVDELLPGELSGGMLKRVALARALIQRPVIVLIDEAFSGLDPVSTKLIEALLQRINWEHGMTMILVSHHIPSTLRMADKIALLLPDGMVEGTPGELTRSGDPRVERFLNENVDEGSDILTQLADYESERVPQRAAPSE